MFYQFEHLGSPEYLKFEEGENFSFPLHLHQCFELITVTEGNMMVTVDKTEYSLSAGDSLLIFPNQIHSLESNDSKHILCIFSARLVQAFASMRQGQRPLCNKFSAGPYVAEKLQQFKGETTTTFKKGLLYSVCALFDEGATYRTSEPEKEQLLFRIFSFVEENFKGDCTLAALSVKSGYDYSYLSRYFKKTVGISFNDYVNQYRISHACYLIKNTEFSVLECAFESGFSSLRSFNRNFKELYNLTPAKYRKNG